MDQNPFEAYAEKIIPAPVKAQMRGAAKRAEKAKQKALAERDQLHRLWQQWRKECIDGLLAGPHAVPAQELIDFLNRMTVEDGDALLALVERQQWHRTDRDTCFLVLHIISGTITYLRELEGLEPFDDPLPFGDNEETSLFFLIREAVDDRTSP